MIAKRGTPLRGSFDGRGKTISNINVGFTPDRSVYRKSLFSCSTEVQNTNFSYISEEQVCDHINDTELVREGSPAGPYIVCSRAHLNAIGATESPAGLLTDSYALYQDINLGPAAEGGDGGDDGKNFDPITGNEFTGIFDGRGKKIINLTISVDGDAGLFLELGTGGVIQNLGIDNFNVATTSTSGNKVGTLAAKASGRIVNCYAIDSDETANNVSGFAGNDSVGGLVGEQNGGSITTSYTTGVADGGAGW